MEQAPTTQVSQENLDEKILREEFERQFANFENIKFENAKFETVDLRPKQEKDIPVVFVPGFGKSPRSYKELIFELFKSDRRVLSVTAPTEDIDTTKGKKYEIPGAQANRALALIKLLESKDIPLVDIVGHSEGGMNAVIARNLLPEQFRHFIFVALPGVTAKQSFIEIAKRGAQNAKYTKEQAKNEDATKKDRYQRSEKDIKQWMRKRGVFKGVLESMNPGRIDIAEDVRQLHKEGHGVVIISGVEDRMLPMKEYQRDRENIPRSAEDLGVDGFVSVTEGHSAAEVSERHGALAADMLNELSKKYQKDFSR